MQVDELLALLLPSGQTTHADAAGRLYERGGHPARARGQRRQSGRSVRLLMCANVCRHAPVQDVAPAIAAEPGAQAVRRRRTGVRRQPSAVPTPKSRGTVRTGAGQRPSDPAADVAAAAGTGRCAGRAAGAERARRARRVAGEAVHVGIAFCMVKASACSRTHGQDPCARAQAVKSRQTDGYKRGRCQCRSRQSRRCTCTTTS